MPRPGLRRAALWTLAVLAGVGTLLGLGRVATGPALRDHPAPAVRALTGPAPDDAIALPPAAAARVLEAITQRPDPVRAGAGAAVLAAVAGTFALGGIGRRVVDAGRVGRAGGSVRPGSTRAPPAAFV